MKYILFVIIVVVAIDTSAYALLSNVISQIKPHAQQGDPGKPLFLSKHIERGEISKARRLASVHHKDIKIPSYSGFLTVNKTYNSNTFFWYFPAAERPKNAPVLVWLQGGPGTSSTFGLFLENGPFSVTADLKMEPRKYSWHLNHHLIYIDNPVGTGYSFTDFNDGYATNEDRIGQELLSAIQQFFLLFPYLQSHPFYISGESYAGKYVPAVGYAIYRDSQRIDNDPSRPKINLQGLSIGNGFVDPINQINYADYLYQASLVDQHGYNQFVKLQEMMVDFINAGDYRSAFTPFNQIFGVIPTNEPTMLHSLTGLNTSYNYLKSQNVDKKPFMEFLQTTEMRRALHVGNITLSDGLMVAKKLRSDVLRSVAPWMMVLLSRYPVLVYNGQMDIICPYPLAANYLKRLDFDGAEVYGTAKRTIWHVDGEVAGYAKIAANLTEVLVRNAGHLVPADQPKWSLNLILHLTHKHRFPNWN